MGSCFEICTDYRAQAQSYRSPTEKQETGEGVSARDHFFISEYTVCAVGRQVDFSKVERFL